MNAIYLKPSKIGLFLWFATVIISCEMIEYHPYDIKSKGQPSNLNQTNIDQIEKLDDDSDTIRFVFMGDTQRSYDETEDFVSVINKRQDIDFVIHGGDITDFGMTKEYTWISEMMEKLRVPYVSLIGNHDIIGHGKELFQKIYGDLNFSFVFRKSRFIYLNTNALEFDYSTPVPDFDFMARFLTDTSSVQRTVVVMHAPPFDDQFNNNSGLMFNYILEHYRNLQFCLHAHRHALSENDYFDNGIMYYGCDDMADRNYLLFTMVGNTYSYQVVHF